MLAGVQYNRRSPRTKGCNVLGSPSTEQDLRECWAKCIGDSSPLCRGQALLHLSCFFLRSAMTRFTRSLSTSCSFLRRPITSSRSFSPAASFSSSAAS